MNAGTGGAAWSAPLWRSGFRPFFLLGALHGPLALAVWLVVFTGLWDPPPMPIAPALWHGHEMVFGFLAAIISGLLLTALPSWAGVPEQTGKRLALLVGAWLAGRVAMALVAAVPAALVAVIDVAALPLLCALLLPDLLRARQRKFTAILPVLFALAFANAAFHVALARGDAEAASTALVGAVAFIVVLYSLVGGFMTPVFTNNALRDQGSAHRAWRHRRLDLCAHAFAVAFAVTQATATSPRLAAAIAAGAAIVHAVRLAGWNGWRVRGQPMVSAMHAGYAWLVVAFVLAAVVPFVPAVGARDWLHAMTVGAIGLMMLALMPRVSLRHTGRGLALSPWIVASYGVMTAAVVLRLAFNVPNAPLWVAAAGALLWAACFVIYLAVHAPMLVTPSLPRVPLDPSPAPRNL